MVLFWIAIGLAVVIGIFTFTRAKKSVADPSLKQIADTIEEYLAGTGGPYDWYDFVTHHSYKDPSLEKIRKDCADIAKKFPPDDAKAWCSELGKNELLKISERVSEESKKVLEARKKSMAEAKARQPATSKPAAAKAPQGKGPLNRGPIGKGPLGKGPAGKNPAVPSQAISPPVVNIPAPATPAPNQPVPSQPVAGVPAINSPAVNSPVVNIQGTNQPAINPAAPTTPTANMPPAA